MNKYHIIRATLESLAYLYDVLKAIGGLGNFLIVSLKVDGGASANNLMQTQADIMDAPVKRPAYRDYSHGSKHLAGLAVGYWKSKKSHKNWAIDRTFEPKD